MDAPPGGGRARSRRSQDGGRPRALPPHARWRGPPPPEPHAPPPPPPTASQQGPTQRDRGSTPSARRPRDHQGTPPHATPSHVRRPPRCAPSGRHAQRPAEDPPWCQPWPDLARRAPRSGHCARECARDASRPPQKDPTPRHEAPCCRGGRTLGVPQSRPSPSRRWAGECVETRSTGRWWTVPYREGARGADTRRQGRPGHSGRHAPGCRRGGRHGAPPDHRGRGFAQPLRGGSPRGRWAWSRPRPRPWR